MCDEEYVLHMHHVHIGKEIPPPPRLSVPEPQTRSEQARPYQWISVIVINIIAVVVV